MPNIRCKNCAGLGWIGPDIECEVCGGAGLIETETSKPARSNYVITLRITKVEADNIKARAHLVHLSINEWLRRVVAGTTSNGYETKHVEAKQTKPDQAESSGSEEEGYPGSHFPGEGHSY